MRYDTPVELVSATYTCAPSQPAPPPVTRAQVNALQDRLVAIGQPVDLSAGLRHYFAPGMYGRELAIPAGLVLTGKVHRHSHLVSLLSGTCLIQNAEGRMERMTGPRTWVSPAGIKRAVCTVTDCVFLTLHLNPTDTTDLVAIEADTIVPETLAAPGEFADALQEMYA